MPALGNSQLSLEYDSELSQEASCSFPWLPKPLLSTPNLVSSWLQTSQEPSSSHSSMEWAFPPLWLCLLRVSSVTQTVYIFSIFNPWLECFSVPHLSIQNLTSLTFRMAQMAASSWILALFQAVQHSSLHSFFLSFLSLSFLPFSLLSFF